MEKSVYSPSRPENPPENHYRSIRQVARKMLADYEKLGTWSLVGQEWGINKGLAYNIAMHGYEPKGAKLRCQLGLPALVLAPPCPIHGVVHTRKTCPKPKQFHGLLDMPVKLLRWKLEHREEVA